MTQGLFISQCCQDLALLAFRPGCDAAKSPPNASCSLPPNLRERFHQQSASSSPEPSSLFRRPPGLLTERVKKPPPTHRPPPDTEERGTGGGGPRSRWSPSVGSSPFCPVDTTLQFGPVQPETPVTQPNPAPLE